MLLHLAFRRLVRRGILAVRWPDGRLRHYGDGGAPHAGLHIRTPRAARRLVFNPCLAPGEGYMKGEIEPLGGSIGELLDVLTLNIAMFEFDLAAVEQIFRHRGHMVRQVQPARRQDPVPLTRNDPETMEAAFT